MIAIGVIAIFIPLVTFVKQKIGRDEYRNMIYSDPNSNLSEVKVATVCEKVMDRKPNGGRNLEDTIMVLKQTQTNFIFLGFWTWTVPSPESPDNIPPALINRVAEYAKTTTKNVP